jgi:hypothetical protein
MRLRWRGPQDAAYWKCTIMAVALVAYVQHVHDKAYDTGKANPSFSRQATGCYHLVPNQLGACAEA